MRTQPALPQLKLKLEWRAYYQRFSEMHGGYPIIYKGRQYFADGWSYSMTDYAGPEWPPPTDPEELATIQKVYWYTRWNRARNELMVLRERYDGLKGLQETKSAPLQQIVTVRNEETKKVEKHIGDWSPAVFDHVLDFIEQEVQLADSKIKELSSSQDSIRESLRNGPPSLE